MTITDPFMLKPARTSEGKPWVQRCYVCAHVVNFLKMKWGAEWVRVGAMVRHKKCKPEVIR